VSDAILNEAPIVDQTRVGSNALQRRKPEESALTSNLPAISGTIAYVARALTPTDGAQ
jgi:hypothetical protein